MNCRTDTYFSQIYLKVFILNDMCAIFSARSLDSILSNAVQGLSVLDCHLVEVEGDTLYLYGSGALDCLDRNWSVQTAGAVTTISFIFIEFDELVHVLTKLKIKFPNFLVRSFLRFQCSELLQNIWLFFVYTFFSEVTIFIFQACHLYV